VAFPAVEALLLRSDQCISIVSVCRVSLRYLIKDPYGGRSCAMVPVEMYQLRSVPRWILCQIWLNWSKFLTIASLISIVLTCYHDLGWAEGFSHASSGAEPSHHLSIHDTDWYRLQLVWVMILHRLISPNWHSSGLKAHLDMARDSGSPSWV
jgi:hypothetical protein